MNKILTLIAVLTLIGFTAFAQTNPTVSLSGSTSCIGSVLTLTSNIMPSQILWKNGVSTVQTTNMSWNGTATTVAASGLSFPASARVDASGNIYVADAGNNRILKFPAGSNGSTAGTVVGEAGIPSGNLLDILVDASGDVYAAIGNSDGNGGNGYVLKYPAGSNSTTTPATVAHNSLSAPYAIYIDGNGNLYCADYFNNAVYRYNAGYTSTTAPNLTLGSGNLIYAPTGVWADASGNIYVATIVTSINSYQIIKYPPNASSNNQGTVVAYAGLSSPNAFVGDVAGNLYVPDGGTEGGDMEILFYPAGSNSITTPTIIGGDSTAGSTATELNVPYTVSLDANGNVFVADNFNNRVQKFSSNTSLTYTTAASGSYTAVVNTIQGGANTTTSVTINASTSISNNPSNTSTCSGGNASFTIAASGTSLIPHWFFSGDGGSTYNPIANGGIYSGAGQLTLNITGATATQNNFKYRCEVSGTCGIATSTGATLTISTVTAGITGTTTGCGSVSLTATGGGTYHWSGGNSTATAANTFTTGGTYTVTVTVGSCTSTTSTNVTVNTIPTVTAGNVSGCAGTSIALNGSPTTGGNGVYSPTSPYTNATAGSYTYTYTFTESVHSCVNTATGNITVFALPTPSAGNVSGCAGTNITLNGSPTSGGIGVYSPTSPYSNATAGSYTYTYTFTESTHSCVNTATGNITVFALPTPSAGNVSGCAGTNITLNGSPTTGGAGVYSPTTPYNNATAGSYTYTYTFTESTHSCVNTATGNITVFTLPTPSAGNVSGCAGTNITLNGSPTSGGAGVYSPTSPYHNNTAGGYTYTYTFTESTHSCVNTATGNITVFALPTPSAGNVSGCAGTNITLNGSPTSGGIGVYSPTSPYTNATPGGYTYTYTFTESTHSCVNTATGNITVYALPTPSAGNVSGCAGTNITLNGSPTTGGIGVYSPTSPYINTTAGGYTYTYTFTESVHSCVNTATGNITVFALPTPSAGNVSGCAGTNITLNGSPTTGGIGVYSPTNPYNNTTAGGYTYTYTFTESTHSCVNTATGNITVYALPTPSAGDVSGCAGTNITLNGSPTTGGAGVYNPTSPYNNATAGSYTYTYTFTESTHNCVNTATGNITVYALPVVSISSNSPVCEEALLTMSSSNSAAGQSTGNSYSWTGYNGYSSNDQNPIVATNANIADNAGDYTVTITNSHNCTASATTTLVVNANPILFFVFGETSGIAPNDGIICNGDYVEINTSDAFYSYNWSTGNTVDYFLSVNPSATTTYYLTVSNVSGCTATDSMTVIVNNNPTPIITGTNPFCSFATSTLDPGSYSSYIWDNSSTSETRTVSTGGTYSVTVTDANGCIGNTSLGVTTMICNSIACIISPTSFCAGASATVNYTIVGNYNAGNIFCAQLSDANGSFANPTTIGTISSTSAGSISVTIPSNAVGTGYRIRVNSSNPGVTGADNGSDITVYANPVASSSITSIIPCNGQNGVITVSATGGTTPYSGTGTNTVAVGAYSYTVSDYNGCTSTTSTSITEPDALTSSSTSGTINCYGQSTSVTVSATGGTTAYTGTGIITNVVAGTYTYTVSDAHGCSTTTSITISQPVLGTFGSSNVNPTCHNGNNGSIGVTNLTGGTGFKTYSNDGGVNFQLSNNFSGLTAGTYSMEVTYGSGCTSVFNVVLTQPTAVTFSSTVTPVGCSTLGSITVTATGGTGVKMYSKNSGTTYQGASLFSGLAVGTYTIQVKDANGCLSGTTSYNLTSSATVGITFTTTVTNPTTCTSSNGGIVVHATGGAGFYNFSKNGGTTYQASNTFNLLTAGTYTVEVKDPTGCVSPTAAVIVGLGCRTLFQTTPVNSSENYFAIYPNPANDHVNVTFSSDKTEACNIRMMDLMGRTVFSDNITSAVGDNQFQLNLSELAKGIYMVILQNGDGTLQKKIVVQ